jgi:hypothetical protein
VRISESDWFRLWVINPKITHLIVRHDSDLGAVPLRLRLKRHLSIG